MNITLRKNQKIDVNIPITRFPNFQTGITMLGAGIPTGVSLSFDIPVSTPQAGETVKLTIQTNANFVGGSFLITGNPVPSNPITINLALNSALEQYELTTYVKAESLTGSDVLAYTYQLTDPLSGTTLAQGTSVGNVAKLSIPLSYSRVFFNVIKAGFNTSQYIFNLTPTQRVVNEVLVLSGAIRNITVKVQIQVFGTPLTGQNYKDTISVIDPTTNAVVYTSDVLTTTQNPVSHARTFPVPPGAVFPLDYIVKVERSGYAPSTKSVRFANIGAVVDVGAFLSTTPSGQTDTSVGINYISTNVSTNGPAKLDLNISDSQDGVTTIIPSNYIAFQYSGVVPYAERTVHLAGKGVIDGGGSYVIANKADPRINVIADGIYTKFVPDSYVKLAVWTVIYDDKNSSPPPVRSKVYIGKRLLYSNLGLSSLVNDIGEIEIHAASNLSQRLFVLPLISPDPIIVPVDLDKIYVIVKSKTSSTAMIREIDLSTYAHGAFLNLNIENVPVYSPTVYFTDYSLTTVTVSTKFKFDAISQYVDVLDSNSVPTIPILTPEV